MTITEHRPRPICAIPSCQNPVRHSGKYSKLGFPLYKRHCNTHSRGLHNPKFHYRQHKKDRCERCGFVPLHTGQLDVDHIDNNHKNNDPANLQTLCKNCHSLRTYAPHLFSKPVDPPAD